VHLTLTQAFDINSRLPGADLRGHAMSSYSIGGRLP
jgi:hypothetical protein